MGEHAETREKGIFARLIQDHDQVSGIIEQIESLDDDDAGECERMFAELKSELLAHSDAEDEVVYALFEQHEPLAQIIRESREEHALVRHVLQELDEMDDADAEMWMAKFKVLKDLIEHHVDEEEGQMFELAKEHIDTEQSEAMMAEFEARKQQLITQAEQPEAKPAAARKPARSHAASRKSSSKKTGSPRSRGPRGGEGARR